MIAGEDDDEDDWLAALGRAPAAVVQGAGDSEIGILNTHSTPTTSMQTVTTLNTIVFS